MSDEQDYSELIEKLKCRHCGESSWRYIELYHRYQCQVCGYQDGRARHTGYTGTRPSQETHEPTIRSSRFPRLPKSFYVLIIGLLGLVIFFWLADNFSFTPDKLGGEQQLEVVMETSVPIAAEFTPTPPNALTPSGTNAPQPLHPESSITTLITPSPTLTPTPTPISPSIEELKQYALELINRDREKHGVAPVVMGTNSAAQMHAEDSLKYEYSGHWYKNGEKPYMVYSRTGGDSYVSENSASGGWSEKERKERRCATSICKVRNPKKHIEEMHYEMMNDDAHADWGHRDLILNPHHLKVNIGLAYQEGFMVTPWWKGFYHHFEGGHFVATEPIGLHGTELTIKIKNVTQEYNYSDFSIAVFYDPPPREMTVTEIERYYGYWRGGGHVPNLSQEDRMAAWIVAPPEPGWSYDGLEPLKVIASKWVETEDYLEIIANLEHRIYNSGVYTVIVWGTHKETEESTSLIELSVVKP